MAGSYMCIPNLLNGSGEHLAGHVAIASYFHALTIASPIRPITALPSASTQ
jgi:hypothetical protein